MTKTSCLIILLLCNISTSAQVLTDNKDLYFLLWENNKTSLEKNGTRGLGGGLEYQISADFCSILKKLFIEKVDCSDIVNELEIGMKQWTEVVPALKFTKLPDSFKTVVNNANNTFPHKDTGELGLLKAKSASFLSEEYSSHGAEIDFMLTDQTTNELSEIAFFAYSNLLWTDKRVKNLLGHDVKSAKLVSSDIVFNIDPKICYIKSSTNQRSIDIPKRCKKVLKLSFVTAHEVGHSLALDHIKENYTIMGRSSDYDPIYEIMQADRYHIKRLYPLKEKDILINELLEDEHMTEYDPEY